MHVVTDSPDTPVMGPHPEKGHRVLGTTPGVSLCCSSQPSKETLPSQGHRVGLKALVHQENGALIPLAGDTPKGAQTSHEE